MPEDNRIQISVLSVVMSEARKGPQEAGDLNLRLLTRIPTQMAALLCFVDFWPNFLPSLRVKAKGGGVGWMFVQGISDLEIAYIR